MWKPQVARTGVCLSRVQPSLVPQLGQNFAPLASAPQLGHTVEATAGRSSWLPQFGQNLAPCVSAPHLGQVSAAGWIMAVPQFGQNLVPGAASVPSLGQRAACAAARLAASDARCNASPTPNAPAR